MSKEQMTRTDYVVREIRRKILTAEYKPGQRIRQIEIERELNVGVTPVREALMQLVSEGLLIRIPYVGVQVSEMTAQSVREVYELRRLLEGQAASLACSHMSEADFAFLKEVLQQMEAAGGHEGDRTYQDLNEQFHMRIYEAAGNNRLLEMIKLQWRSFPRGIFGLMEDRRKHSLDQHRLIYEALKEKDAHYARSLMEVHIAESQHDALSLIASRKTADASQKENDLDVADKA